MPVRASQLTGDEREHALAHFLTQTMRRQYQARADRERTTAARQQRGREAGQPPVGAGPGGSHNTVNVRLSTARSRGRSTTPSMTPCRYRFSAVCTPAGNFSPYRCS